MVDTGFAADLTALLERQAAGWAAGDASAFAACFTADAEYVTWVGTRYRGRTEIATSHAALFDKFLKGTTMFWEVLSVRTVSPGVAVVVTRGDVAKSRPKRLSKIQTYVIVDGAEAPLIASFQNTRRRRLMESLSFRVAPSTRPAQ